MIGARPSVLMAACFVGALGTTVQPTDVTAAELVIDEPQDGPALQAIDALYVNDPDADAKRRIELLMGTYLIHPRRRHASERVEIDRRRGGNRVRVHCWRALGAAGGSVSEADLLTLATRWLLVGRTRAAQGAPAVFRQMPEVSEIALVLLEIQRTETRRGRRERTRPYLALRLRRRHFEAMDLGVFRACLERGRCADEARAHLDVQLNRRFLRKRLTAEP